MTQIFKSFAEAQNPQAINLNNGNEEYVLNTEASHLVEVTDPKSGEIVIVIGSRYRLLSYIETLEGKYTHTRVRTVKQFINNLFS